MNLPATKLGRLVTLALAMNLGACAETTTKAVAGNPASRAIGDSGVSETSYTIQPGDRVRVTVYGDTQLTGEYGVDDSGAVTLPLAGPISLAGRTLSDAAKTIVSVLRTAEIFRDPKVTVDVLTLRPFYILGEVTRPGEYPYKPGISLYAAVATAGGYTYRADTGSVRIRRANETTEREYKLTSDIMIMPGDVIRVPERYF